jgi:release factor glutamine methyltransferase
VRILTLPGVLRPPSDCWLLARVMREHELARGRTVLDVFTGTGALAVAAALDGARVVSAVDVSRRAVLNARLNARLNCVRVRALRGDLFAPVRGERFDLIVANPPYVPGASDTLPDRGAARAWEGGIDGRALLDRLCAEVGDHLTPGGALLVVHSSLAGERATLEGLRAAGLGAEVVARRRGPLGPIVAARAELLERRGALAPGQREEELVVVRASPFAPRPHPPPSRRCR